MKRTLITILDPSYVRILLGGLVTFIAVIGGLYVGSGITGSQAENRPETENGLYTLEGQHIRMPEEYYPTFGPGDLFPMVDCEFVDGSPGYFEDLLEGKKSILLLVHFDCGACDRLLYDWHSWAGLNIRSEIQVLLCIGQSPDEIAPSAWDAFIAYGAVFIDRRLFGDDFNVIVWPTIVCVDQFGLITALQVGYKDVFSEDIARSLR